jgi:hypothetical protein
VIQESLLLKIMECIDSAGVQMALSPQSLLMDASSTDAAGVPLSRTLAQDYKTSANPPNSK